MTTTHPRGLTHDRIGVCSFDRQLGEGAVHLIGDSLLRKLSLLIGKRREVRDILRECRASGQEQFASAQAVGDIGVLGDVGHEDGSAEARRSSGNVGQ